VAWYLRAVELPDGEWACRWGSTQWDTHPHLTDALTHLHELGKEMGDYITYVHHLGQRPQAGDAP